MFFGATYTGSNIRMRGAGSTGSTIKKGVPAVYFDPGSKMKGEGHTVQGARLRGGAAILVREVFMLKNCRL